MTGPQDPAAVGGGRLRAGHADREQAIETLKNAFVAGRLTSDELDARTGQALAARTYADLAALTADIPPAPATPAAAGLASLPASARPWPLARAAAKSGGCLALAFALVWFAANVLDPNGLGNPYAPWSTLCVVAALISVVAAVGSLADGVATSVEQRHARRQLPPRPGPGGHAGRAARGSATSAAQTSFPPSAGW